MKKMLAAMVLILGFSNFAMADILFEPYIGTETGTFSHSDGKLTGTALGARLAYKFPLFVWAGLDASMGSSGKYSPTGSTEADMKHNTYYGVVGVNLPILLRVWAGYGLSDQFVIDNYNSTMKGTNTKFGVGFTPLPLVSLNVEYVKGTVSEITGGSLANSSPGTTSESYMFSISLPLYF